MNRDRIQQIAATIVEALHPRRLVLFGSHARGEDRPDSDLDLFVEMETDLRPPDRVAAVDALFGLRKWSLDVIVYTPEETRRLEKLPGSLVSRIEAEGEVLYERS